MIAKQKKALREHYRQVRDALLPDERLAQSQEICTRIMQTELYAQAQSVLLYAAQGSEIDLSTLARDAWEKGKTVAYPRCLDGQGHMAFYTVDAPERLVPGKFSIPEPDEHCPQWQAKGNVLCIVPALAVDAHGHRLGYGKGYYDRFLATFDGVWACAVYDVCVAKSLPHDALDVPMQYIIDGKGAWQVDEKDPLEIPVQESEQSENQEPENIIDDDDFASEQDAFAPEDDYGEQDEDTWADDLEPEEDVSHDSTENIHWQRFMYKWKRIPLIGKLPFDPVLLLVLGNFLLLLLSRLIDTLLLNRDNEYLIVVLLQILIFIIPGYLFLRFRGKGYAKRMRLQPPRPEHILIVLSATGALITGCFLLSVLMGNLSEGQSFVLYDTFTSRHDGTVAGVVYLVVAYAVLPAVCEELIYRSVLCAEFEGRGVVCAVVVSSILFSMLHFNLLAMPVYLFAGLLLALTLYATRSVFCTMIVHFLYNLFCLFGQSAFADFYVTQSATTLFIIILIAVLILCLGLFCGESSRLYRLYAKQNASDAYRPAQKLSGTTLAVNIGLAFVSPGALACLAIYLIVCIFR